MRFMMMVKGDTNYEQGIPPRPELVAEMDKFIAEMTRDGVLLDTGGLAPSAVGAKIVVDRGELRVIDGPFAGVKEVVGGFTVIQAKSIDEALELGSRFMRLHLRVLGESYSGECEIRQML
ncbi:YciI family protein [Nannocystis pusilla]|uniref:YciI family protein n=1 Tax=Nannocystis pusilla TaxID=889268 RepID=A0ABS7U5Q8_9BACT|nr:YciI family protein [Nannocystis pusilla]MBZ5715897.1 YciI family protein [Nannocystis pusilla]